MAQIEGISTVMDKVVGSKPVTCPWRTYNDPLLIDVMQLRAKAKAKALTTRRDIPQRTLDALAAFESANNACRYEKMERDRKAREAESAKNKPKKR